MPEIYYRLALHVAFSISESRVTILCSCIARAKFVSQKNKKVISQHENLFVRETLAKPSYVPLSSLWLLIFNSYYALSCLGMTIEQLLTMNN